MCEENQVFYKCKKLQSYDQKGENEVRRKAKSLLQLLEKGSQSRKMSMKKMPSS